jgi:hypothetical protein
MMMNEAWNMAMASNLDIDKRNEFHDEQLVQLTDKLNNLFRELKPREGKKLGITTAPSGLFLAWIDERPSTGKQYVELDDDSIEEVFGLK